MRRKVTKAAALLSAVLMASSSVPYGVLIPYNVLAEEVSADAGVAAQEETAATVGSVTNIRHGMQQAYWQQQQQRIMAYP